MPRTPLTILLFTTGWLALAPPAALPQPKTRNVVLIVADGLRWQEVFTGADPTLINRQHGGVRDPDALRKEFIRPSAAEARQTLLPFFWTVIARQGQVFGNRSKDSEARVVNGLNFSYPGYNELLTGRPDPRIDRNDAGPNPNLTVFEFLNRQPELRGRVAAFGTWGVFIDIFNRQRSGFPVHAGWEPPAAGEAEPRLAMLADLFRTTTRLWENNLYDAFMHAALKEYLRGNRPRLLFVGYGETDEWPHLGRYDLTLRSAHQFDRFVRELWELFQSRPEYRDRTTFILATDHGRGGGRSDWTSHGRDVKGSEAVWIAALGPDTPPLGERQQAPPVTLGQAAATIAALLGYDWQQEAPGAAAVLPDVLAKPAAGKDARQSGP